MWKPEFEHDDLPDEAHQARIRENHLWMQKTEDELKAACWFFLLYLLGLLIIAL